MIVPLDTRLIAAGILIILLVGLPLLAFGGIVSDTDGTRFVSETPEAVPSETEIRCPVDSHEAQDETTKAQKDADGDGIIDRIEISDPARYPNSSPGTIDIYVEIDHMNGTTVPRGALGTIEHRFAAQNISLHLMVNDTIPAETVDVNGQSGNPTTFKTLRDRHFERRDHIYHYALIATDLAGSDRLAGKRVGPDFVIEAQPTANRTGFAFMHELGHAVGIAATDSASIDGRRAPFEQYPSVMN